MKFIWFSPKFFHQAIIFKPQIIIHKHCAFIPAGVLASSYITTLAEKIGLPKPLSVADKQARASFKVFSLRLSESRFELIYVIFKLIFIWKI